MSASNEYAPVAADDDLSLEAKQKTSELSLISLPNNEENSGTIIEVELATVGAVEQSGASASPSVESAEENETDTAEQERTKARSSFVGLLFMLGAALFFSIMSLLVNMSGGFAPFLELTAVRSGVMFVLTIAFLYITGNDIVGKREHWPILFGRAIFGFASLSGYFFALTRLPLGDAVVLSFTNPVFTTLLARVVLSEQLVLLDLVGAMLSFTGVVLIARPTFIFGQPEGNAVVGVQGLARWLTVGVSLCSAMCSAVAYVLVRKLGPAVHAYTLVNWFAFLSTTLATAGTFAFEQPVLPPTWVQWGWWLAMGIAGFIGQGMLNRGLQLERAGTAASMNYVQIVFAFLFQVFLLKQKPAYTSAIGALLICAYAVLLLIKKFLSTRAAGKK